MSDEFKVGAATVSLPLDNSRGLLFVEGVHADPPTLGVLEDNKLYADILAFQAGGRTALVATSDSGVLGTRRDPDTRQAVAEATGLDEKLVIVANRHNHSCIALPIDEKNAEAVEAADECRRKNRANLIAACQEALADLRPAEIVAGTTTLKEPMGINRRMRYGHGGVMPCWGSGPVAIPGEKFCGPAGPDSKRIDFLVVREVGRREPFALLTAYASHIHLIGIPYWCGEVVGGVKQALRARLPGLRTIAYGTTTGGDLDMHCVLPGPHSGLEDQMRWYRQNVALLGRRFAEAVVPAIPAEGYFRPAEIRQEYFSTQEREPERRPRQYVINALRFGPDVALAAIPTEMFIELVNQVYAGSPFKHLLLLGFSGAGSMGGYIGPPIAYEQGGYEMSRGPAPSPAEEEKAQPASGRRARLFGRSRPETGLDIARTILEVLQRLAK